MSKKTLDLTRTAGAIDAILMKDTHIVCIGVGGANQLVENLVRSGVGTITIVDFDDVEPHNLAIQGWYQNEIGMKKVEALKVRCKNVNPQVDIHAICEDFITMGPKELDNLMSSAGLLLMMTDNFYAQAFGNLMALKYQVPTIFASMYEAGMACEISFVVPGMTPACHRCITSPRYDAYIKDGYRNQVVSTGSTMFPTQYINSALGLIALAVLNRKAGNPELAFSEYFSDIWKRNFIQLRLSPKYIANFSDHSSEQFFMDCIWQSIEPERPPEYEHCPDCGGSGHLEQVTIEQSQISELIGLYTKSKHED